MYLISLSYSYNSSFIALDKQIEEFEDLFLSILNSKDTEKSNVILYPIGNAVQVNIFQY